MSNSFDCFDLAFDHLDHASSRVKTVERMFEDIARDWFADDLEDSLDGLLELMVQARRSMSQAVAWLEKSRAYLETEGADDGTGAGGEREGQGQALPDA